MDGLSLPTKGVSFDVGVSPTGSYPLQEVYDSFKDGGGGGTLCLSKYIDLKKKKERHLKK